MKRIWRGCICTVAAAIVLCGCTKLHALLPAKHTQTPLAATTSEPDGWSNGVQLIGDQTAWQVRQDGADASAGEADRTSWTTRIHTDGAWSTASGSFGEKDGKLQPVGKYMPDHLLNAQNDAGDPVPCWYFRTTLRLFHTDDIVALRGTLYYDDAVVVYLNGTPIFEGNLPPEGFSQNAAFGAESAQDAPREGVFHISCTLLQDGDNILAVELHQAAPGSTDAYFHFASLFVTDEAPVLETPTLAMFAGRDATQREIRWRGTDASAALCYAEGRWTEGNLPDEYEKVSSRTAVNDPGCRTALLHGLKPDTAYTYWIQTDLGNSQGHSFVTAKADTFTMLYLGDPQLTGNGSAERLAQTLQAYPSAELILSAGDQVNDSEDLRQYEAFLEIGVFQSIPLAACRGNHEDATLYQKYFLPESAEQSRGDYAFTYGSMLLCCLDTNDTEPESHAAFIKRMMDIYPRTWTVVSMHHSVFGIGKHADEANTLLNQQAYAELFRELGVDVVLSGHDHSYARTKLMDGMQPVEQNDATTLCPQKGQVLYISAGSSTGTKYYASEVLDAAPFACMDASEQAGILVMDVTTESFTITRQSSENGEVLDRVTLKKNKGTQPSGAAENPYQTMAAFLRQCQLSNGAFANLPVTDGKAVINPYFGSYAALALANIGETDAAKAYLDWHFQHLNAQDYDKNGLAYTIYDYRATVQSGQVTEEQATMQYDSTDSYAAVLFLALDAWYQQTGDRAYVLDRYLQCAGVMQVMLYTMQDGLSCARPDYAMQYLMDNCEVFAGMEAAVRLLEQVWLPAYENTDRQRDAENLLQKLQAAQQTLRSAIEQRLWREKENCYCYAAQPEKAAVGSQMDRFYPDAVAQLFPALFGVIDAGQPRAQALYQSFCNAWDWENLSYYKNGDTPHYWGVLAACAAHMGDQQRLNAYLQNLQRLRAQDDKDALFVSEAAWIVLAGTKEW